MKKHQHKLPHPGRQPYRRPRFPREVAILYEDESLVALDKPPGLLAVPVKGTEAESALSILAAELRSRREQVFVVHRIDRFASGILLFAKTKAARDTLVRQFLEHRPVRQYLAVVRGHLARNTPVLDRHPRLTGQHSGGRWNRRGQYCRHRRRWCGCR